MAKQRIEAPPHQFPLLPFISFIFATVGIWTVPLVPVLAGPLAITEFDWKNGSIEITNYESSSISVTSLEISNGTSLQDLEAAPFAFPGGQVRVYRITIPVNSSGQIWLHLNRNGTINEPGSIISGLIWGSPATGSQPADTVAAEASSVWADASDFVSGIALDTGQSLQRISIAPGSSAWIVGNTSWSAYGFQPDLLIGRSYSSVLGDGIYSTSGARQRIKLYSWNRKRVSYSAKLQNDGAFNEYFLLKGQSSNRDFKVQWLQEDAGNISSELATGRLLEIYTNQDEAVFLKSTVRPNSRIRKKRRRFKVWLSVSSQSDTSYTDYVYGLVQKSTGRPRRRPDWGRADVPVALGDANANGVGDLAEAIALSGPDWKDGDGDGVADRLEILIGRDPTIDEFARQELQDSQYTTGLTVFSPLPTLP